MYTAVLHPHYVDALSAHSKGETELERLTPKYQEVEDGF